MKRDPKAFLYEIIEAADAIAMAVAGLILRITRLITRSVLLAIFPMMMILVTQACPPTR